jgi:hypothetical protein
MKKVPPENWIAFICVLLMVLGLFSRCTNGFDGVSEDQRNLAKSIILSKYPNFESEIQQRIKAQNPTYVGAYGYRFEKTEQENILVVNYGVSGLDWLDMINPFNNKSKTDISISVRVDFGNKLVVPVTCVPNDSWLSSRKTVCN